MAAAVILGGTLIFQQPAQEPEFPSFVDPVTEVTVEEEETPLASQPKVTTKTTRKTKTTKKKVKLRKASSKSYTKKLPTKKKTTSKTKKVSDGTVKVDTTVTTVTKEKYTKKKKTKLVTSKVTTVVKTTTTTMPETDENVIKTASGAEDVDSVSAGRREVSVAAAAPLMDSRVTSAFQTLGFKVYVDPSVNYSGYFDAKSRSITLKSEGATIYHELGHFLAFVAGNVDKSPAFQSVYNGEKDSFTGLNKAYCTQNSSEYFAESVKEYTLSSGSIGSRPKTLAAVQQALDMVTDAQVAKVQSIYAPYWN